MNFLFFSLLVGTIAIDPRALSVDSGEQPGSGKVQSPGGYGPPAPPPVNAANAASPGDAVNAAGPAIPATPDQSSSDNAKSCPKVWTKIAAEFKKDFAGCNNLARSAIRFAFHDSGGYSSKNDPYLPASGGADGSLLLNEEEISREAEQNMKAQFRDPYLLPAYKKYKDQGVSAADIVQFAGSVGVRSCKIENGNLGLVIRTVVGRKDSQRAAPDGNLPAAFGPNATAKVLIKLWEDKGFSARELAALVGAHSTSTAFAQTKHGVPEGGAQDDTPTTWDNRYFQVQEADKIPKSVYRFESDVNLATQNDTTKHAYDEFAKDANLWHREFMKAFFKLGLVGIPASDSIDFVDCTDVIAALY